MRLSKLCVALALCVSIPAFAQEPMPMNGGGMGNAMKSQPMPESVEDNREVVPLTEPERAIVNAQMRQMLASVQGVTDGLARKDLKAVIEAASQSGMAMMQGVPSQIRMKFPQAFSQMGMMTHKAFDRIAKETKSIRNPAPVLKQLATAMQSCLACHATYRFAPPK
jgi:cytochrome c556